MNDVIRLEDFEPPAVLERMPARDDWRAVTRLCERLALIPANEYRVRLFLGALLVETASNAHARVCWQEIKAAIDAPLPPDIPGEPAGHSKLNRLRQIDALYCDYRRHWSSVPAPCVDPELAGYAHAPSRCQ
jgi:hypothetical protein